MKKKKAEEERWCPLIGQYIHLKHDSIIERAREYWSITNNELRTPEGDVIGSSCFTQEAMEKARTIYEKWDSLQNEEGRLDVLMAYVETAISDPDPGARERSLGEVISWFRELNASGLEVFSVLAIYEARVAKNDAWPLDLLSLAGKYTPDVTLGKQRRKQIQEWGSRRWMDSDVEKQKSEWLKLGKEYRKKYPEGKPRFFAEMIRKKLELPEKRFQSIYKYLLKNNV